MSDYNSHTERDTFNEAICSIVEEYLQDKDAYPTDTVLSTNSKTTEMQLGVKADFAIEWDTFPIENLIRINEDNTGKEVDIDATFELASTYFFVH